MTVFLLYDTLTQKPLPALTFILLGVVLRPLLGWASKSFARLLAFLTGRRPAQGSLEGGDEAAASARDEESDTEADVQDHGIRASQQLQAAVEEEAASKWYISVEDAKQLLQRTSDQDQGLEPGWKHMLDKEVPGVFKYSAYRRTLPGGQTEYRSITTSPRTSPLELMEFLLDDDARRGWEAFLIQNSILEQGAWLQSREQVVRWVRRFPFHFLTDREYVVARKVWGVGPGGQLMSLSRATTTAPGAPLFAITRDLDEHPAAPRSHSLVRTSNFYSCWRCSAVPDPWGGPDPAAAVVLIHRENIHIPEYLAKTAVGMGMSKFVKELVGGLTDFKTARRGRGVDPLALDPIAYGHDFERTSHMHPHHMRSGALNVGYVQPGADYDALAGGKDVLRMSGKVGSGRIGDGAGVSAAESLHMHPHRRGSRRGSHHDVPVAFGSGNGAVTAVPTADGILVTAGGGTPLLIAPSGNDTASSTVTSSGTTPRGQQHYGLGSPGKMLAGVATRLKDPFAAAQPGMDPYPPKAAWPQKVLVGLAGAAALALVQSALRAQHQHVHSPHYSGSLPRKAWRKVRRYAPGSRSRRHRSPQVVASHAVKEEESSEEEYSGSE